MKEVSVLAENNGNFYFLNKLHINCVWQHGVDIIITESQINLR